MTVHAIGDIHGELDKLRVLHRRIAALSGEDALIVHLGDLIDRGPDSRGVVEYLMQGQAQGRNWVVLKGNHDRFLPRFLAEPEWIDPGLNTPRHWVTHEGIGAAATLRSYGVDPGLRGAALHRAALGAIPVEHVDWLAGLPAFWRHPLALFVHAGIRPGVDIAAQTEQDMLWIRQPFLDDRRDHGVLVVHGHTPVRQVEHHGNRLNIDTGAVFGRQLSAVRIAAEGVGLVGESGVVPLRPIAPKPGISPHSAP